MSVIRFCLYFWIFIANLSCPSVLLSNYTIINAFKLNFISKISHTTTVTCHQLKRNFSLLHLKYVQSLTLKNSFVREPPKSLKHGQKPQVFISQNGKSNWPCNSLKTTISKQLLLFEAHFSWGGFFFFFFLLLLDSIELKNILIFKANTCKHTHTYVHIQQIYVQNIYTLD